jgi:C4-dicarboxylate-binding protein DctP
MTVTHYSTGPDPFIVDLQWYEKLPVELRTKFDTVAVETMQYSDNLNRAAEEAMIKKLEEVLEVNYLNADELRAFQDLAQGVYDKFIEQGAFTNAEILQAKAIARGESEVAP